jgi:hypothetical protein
MFSYVQFPDKPHNVPKTPYIFVEKYSLETSQTSAVYEAMMAYSKMAARRQLQNGA